MPLNPKRVQAVFLKAADHHDLADRAAILDRECWGDSELRQRVQALLMADDRFNDLANQPLVGPSWLDCGRVREFGGVFSSRSRISPRKFVAGTCMAEMASDPRHNHLVYPADRRPWIRIILHEGVVHAVAFSPDGRVVLTGCNDKTAPLRELATGKPVGPPLAHEGAVQAVAFSPDGRVVVTGSNDKTARLWAISDLPDDLPRLTTWVELATGPELDCALVRSTRSIMQPGGSFASGSLGRGVRPKPA